MGADGGVKLQRKDLIKQKKLSEYDEASAEAYNKNGKWTTCHLSNKPLAIPIVSDYKGNLYNKDSILEYILYPDTISTNQKQLVEYIKSLKDIVELKIQTGNDNNAEFICPITGNVIGSNGITYVYLVSCGDVFAEKCLREVNGDDRNCPVCNQQYEDQDVIVLNPISKKSIEHLEDRIQLLISRNLTHSMKKQKKQKKRKSEEAVTHKSKKVKV